MATRTYARIPNLSHWDRFCAGTGFRDGVHSFSLSIHGRTYHIEPCKSAKDLRVHGWRALVTPSREHGLYAAIDCGGEEGCLGLGTRFRHPFAALNAVRLHEADEAFA
jgi:hypothetical protein